MKQQILTALQTLLSINGYVLEKSSSKTDISDFIGQLKPYQTNHPLIRLGAEGDGGYLVPDDLEGISACFSPGVGAFSTFENACAERGMEVFLADYSVAAPQIANERFHFIPKFIGPVSRNNFIGIEEWITEHSPKDNSDLLLQMDIEGHEYQSVLSIPDNLLNRFRIIVIELHYLEKLWSKSFYATAKAVANKLTKNHACVHIHPNNYCGIETIQGIEIPRTAEFTFLRNDRIQEKTAHLSFPHKLDYDNIREHSIALPDCWYKA